MRGAGRRSAGSGILGGLLRRGSGWSAAALWHAAGAAVLLILLGCPAALRAQVPGDAPDDPRRHETLDTAWRVCVSPSGAPAPAGVTGAAFDDTAWAAVEVPHNADTYHGYRQVKHGNLHGSAWYRRTFALKPPDRGRRVFLFFEGVGSYATVWVNGREIGRHAGGLTTFTLDATDAVRFDAPNFLVVRADHPAGIRDLPWVCGGCERAYGFSEGSQPFGIFRPVHVVVTDSVRVAPFGVHVWNDRDISAERATAHVRTELANHDARESYIRVRTSVRTADGRIVAEAMTADIRLAPRETILVPQTLEVVGVRLWSLDEPYRYTLRTEVLGEDDAVRDRVDTPFGFRWIDWPHGEDAARGTFLLNGKPVFLNGTCEYPHQLGGGHAFTAEQIDARADLMRAAGFNAFRDAHHPHNLRYQEHWDRRGLAWWTQFGAQIWFDSEAFRSHYVTLLRDWVKERRNSPSLVLWGLQNESKLPEAFARACTELIRELDPTASGQRLVVTCNGGEGTDWDVPQNWTGTYGGDPLTYADDLRRQFLVGEYGGWRSAGLHTEPGTRSAMGYDEETFTALMETKVRLAETVRDEVAGHFQWIFSTHDNPGRTFGAKGEQLADGWGRLDRIGPANNKGLLTTWGEPVDAYFMYRSNYAPVATEPMVVIAGATSPGRWTAPGPVDGIIVYSNAEEVELFNDHGRTSLGTRRRGPRGTHFRWDGVELRTNVLHAVARQDGRPVASDTILLHHLPPPSAADPDAREPDHEAAAAAGWETVYRVNCGGPDYTDVRGRVWSADRTWREGLSWGSLSWAGAWPHLPPELGSVRRVHVPIAGTADDPLYQTIRYGRHALRYRFEVPDGEYRVELHFAEPWYGRGGGVDAAGWRLFDVAINGEVVLRDVDLWREAGYARAVRRSVTVRARDGRIEVSFPRVAANQAVISAIAIARRAPGVAKPMPAEAAPDLRTEDGNARHGLDTGVRAFPDAPLTVARIPEALRHRTWVSRPLNAIEAPWAVTSAVDGELFVGRPADSDARDAPAATPDETIALAGGQPASLAMQRVNVRAGEPVRLPHAALAVLVPHRPLAPPQAIRGLQVSGSRDSAAWRAAGNLQRGDRPRGEEEPGFTQLPSDLTDSDWIVTPPFEPSADLKVRFEVADHIEAYVGLAASAEMPEWLARWLPHDGKVSAGSIPFRLFKRRFAQGETVHLGRNGPLPDGNPAPMYVVLVRPVRPSATYPVSTDGSGGLGRPGASHTWTIQVGVGDRYTFVVRHDPIDADTRVRYTFSDESGAVLCTEDLTATAAADVPDPALRVRTCTSVNAGTYQVRVELLEGRALNLRELTVE